MQCMWTTYMDEVQVNYNINVSPVHTYVQMSLQYSEKGSLIDLKISFSFISE